MADSNVEILWLDKYDSAEPRGQYGVLTCGGYAVPYLEVYKRNDPSQDGAVSLILDKRFVIDIEEYELKKWLWLVANAMAVAAGYPCLGSHEKRGPFATQVGDLDVSLLGDGY